MSEQAPDPDEVSGLLRALAHWTRENFPPPPGGMAGSTCEWCPLCQFLAVLRGDRPELTERVVEAGSALLGAVRAIVDTAPDRPRPRPRPRPRVEDE